MEGFPHWVEASAFGQWVRQSADVYPVANVVHLFGLVALLGAVGVVDLRVAGAFRSLPMRPLSAALTPVSIAGFALLLLSGPILFAADAVALWSSDVFRWKIALIFVAGANALAFHFFWRRQPASEPHEPATLALRGLALASLALWLTILTLGRMIAYR